MVTPWQSVWPCDSAASRCDACVGVNPQRRATCCPEPYHVNSCQLGLNMREVLSRSSTSPSTSAPSAPRGS
eukprot:3279416-Pyramimonas_sp.AAC.1